MIENFKGRKKNLKNMGNKQYNSYLANFFTLHSVIALCCGIGTLIFSFNGIIAGVIRAMEIAKINGFAAFTYFTMIANTISTCSAAFIIPYAVEGIQRKRFVLPKWVVEFHFVATTSITIMMVFVLSFMSWIAPDNAFGDSNIIMHVFCPILILISFFQIENRYTYSIKECLMGCIPFYIYIIVYYIEVDLIGVTNGGWPDIYHVLEYISSASVIPLLLVFGLVVSLILACISNHLAKIREKKIFQYWKKDLNSDEAKLEAYKFGEMMSHVKDKDSVIIPLDILEYISKKSNISIKVLATSYVKGFISGKQEGKSL